MGYYGLLMVTVLMMIPYDPMKQWVTMGYYGIIMGYNQIYIFALWDDPL